MEPGCMVVIRKKSWTNVPEIHVVLIHTIALSLLKFIPPSLLHNSSFFLGTGFSAFCCVASSFFIFSSGVPHNRIEHMANWLLNVQAGIYILILGQFSTHVSHLIIYFFSSVEHLRSILVPPLLSLIIFLRKKYYLWKHEVPTPFHQYCEICWNGSGTFCITGSPFPAV